ncbi:MAG: hypothetical protein ACSI46_28520 [Gloeotrichia echinulata DVL01]|jgi:predicted nucleic acid-binding protein
MNGRVFLDTSILVYIYDFLDTAKQERAMAVTDQLIRSGKAVISTQVMGEFFMATTRTRRLLRNKNYGFKRDSRVLFISDFIKSELVLKKSSRE